MCKRSSIIIGLLLFLDWLLDSLGETGPLPHIATPAAQSHPPSLTVETSRLAVRQLTPDLSSQGLVLVPLDYLQQYLIGVLASVHLIDDLLAE